MKMTNRQAAVRIIRRLRDEGFEALLAGGCVRDMLLGRRAKDYDVATDAKPGQVSKLFRRTLSVGAQFGVVIVLQNSRQIEVATFRTESGYADGRHPQNVAFSNARQDAARRDFTINGIFYDPLEDKVYDYVGGREDIKTKVLRTIGRPGERFGEDYLRMLRAIRFSAQLDFDIDGGTWQAVCRNSANITRISGERIAMELEKILVSPNRAKGAEMLCRSGLAEAVFPDFSGGAAVTGIEVLQQLDGGVSFMQGFAGLFAGFDTDFAISKSDVLMLSNNQLKKLRFLLENRDRLIMKVSLADLKNLLYSGYFEELLALQRAIEQVKGGSLSLLEEIASRAEKLNGVQLHPRPLLDGDELMELGIPEGPMIGEVSRQMYYHQLNEELKDKKTAIEWVKKRYPY